MRNSRSSSAHGGFTLLETVISFALFALLIGMVMGLASQNIGLGRDVVDKQNEVSTQEAFIQFLGRQFSAIPGNARIELTSEDNGAQYLSDLTIQNVPLSFNWGSTERVAKAIQLSTERRRDGLLDIVIRYYEDEILETTEELGDISDSLDNEPFAEVVLLEDVYAFEWQVLDGRTMEWQYDWDLVGRLPLQMELVYATNRDEVETPIRQIFWITPKQNPEVMMRQLQQQGGQSGGDPATPGDGQTPSIEIPASPSTGSGRTGNNSGSGSSRGAGFPPRPSIVTPSR